MAVEVTLDDGRVEVLAVGESMDIGRAAGRGRLGGDDRRVSRRHGVIAALEDGTWTATATGTLAGLVIYDHETPSRLHVPAGVGPVAIPFARSSLVVEVREQRYACSVVAAGLTGWTGSWASVLGASARPRDKGTNTQVAWDDVRGRDPRTGRPLRWFQLLVALCEPRLGDPPEDRIPTDDEVAARLGVTPNRVGSRLVGRAREELGLPSYTPQLRQAMVSIAISQGLVTSHDLVVLDRDPLDDPA